MDNDKIGVFIAKKRLEKGLTQNELGDKLYVTGKAVSKWERGLSLPDISILEKLADILETDIYDILQIEKKNNVDIEKILNEERLKIKKQFRFKILIFSIPIIVLILFGIFKIFPFGYDIDLQRYEHNTSKIIKIAKPKFSFLVKSKEDSFTYKNIRSKKVLYNEVSDYVKTLMHLTCNNTTYYYDSNSNTTIIDYKVTGNLFYNNIMYNVRNGNYCNRYELKSYAEVINLDESYSIYNEPQNLYIDFKLKGIYQTDKNKYTAKLNVGYYEGNSSIPIKLEESDGTFLIIDNELIYQRTNISYASDSIEVPSISKFIIKSKRLILKDNYLDKYEESVVLK